MSGISTPPCCGRLSGILLDVHRDAVCERLGGRPFDPCRLLALGYLVWSLATALTGLATGFAMLLSLRLLLGVEESVIFPTASKILARYLPEERRGFANGVVGSGMRCGAVVGSFGGGLLMARYGWVRRFSVSDCSGCLASCLVAMEAAGRAERRCGGEACHARVRRDTETALVLGRICGPFLPQLPAVLYGDVAAFLPGARAAHDDGRDVEGGCLVLPDGRYLGLCVGLALRRVDAPRRQNHNGPQDSGGRGMWTFRCIPCVSIGRHSGDLSLLPDRYWRGRRARDSGAFAFGQTLAGTDGVGRWTGLQNGFANLSGVIGPALTGFLVDRTGHFGAPVAIAAAMSVAGGCAWVFGVGRLEEIPWKGTGRWLPADLREAV